MTRVLLHEPKRRTLGKTFIVVALLLLPLGVVIYFADYSDNHTLHCTRAAEGDAVCVHRVTSRWHEPKETGVPGEGSRWTNKRIVTHDSKGRESVTYHAEANDGRTTRTIVNRTDAQLSFDNTNAWLRLGAPGEHTLLMREATIAPIVICACIAIALVLLGLVLFREQTELVLDPAAHTFTCRWRAFPMRSDSALTALDDMLDFHFTNTEGRRREIATDVMIERLDGSKDKLIVLPGYAWKFLSSRSRPLRSALLAYRDDLTKMR